MANEYNVTRRGLMIGASLIATACAAQSASGEDEGAVAHPLGEAAGVDGDVEVTRLGGQDHAAELGDPKELLRQAWVEWGAVEELAPVVGVEEARGDRCVGVGVGHEQLFGQLLAHHDLDEWVAGGSVGSC